MKCLTGKAIYALAMQVLYYECDREQKKWQRGFGLGLKEDDKRMHCRCNVSDILNVEWITDN